MTLEKYFKNFGTIILLLFLIKCNPKVSIDSPKEKDDLFILSAEDLPDYERDIDHAGIINNWTEEFYHKGMITYRNVCFNCHGNEEQSGSMPNSTKFWSDSLKYGSDPYSMYQTLTQGYGMMAPQVNLSPQEKYEVIHFIREEYIKKQNPTQYFLPDSIYMSSLPNGNSAGPAPKKYQPWADMDYGNFLMYTYEYASSDDPPRVISGGRSPLANEDYRDINFAYKGIAIRLNPGKGGVAAGNAFALFDHDLLRFVGFWTGEGFIDYRSILLNDEHNIYPRTVGQKQIENPIMPGWADPATGEFLDPRFVAVDGRPFGPLPRNWAHYKGLYYHEGKVVLQYTVGESNVLEKYDLVTSEKTPVISRTLQISPSPVPLQMLIAPAHVDVSISGSGGEVIREDGRWILSIPAKKKALIKLTMSARRADNEVVNISPPEDLSQFTHGGKPHYIDVPLSSPIILGNEEDAYAVDVFQLPQINPWKSRMRPTGIDFLEGGNEAVVSTIDGEVWKLEGISNPSVGITWKRIATGLFQPLGIKYHRGAIYVGCRDQIAVLRDLNGDGETDYYESFNSDHQVTEHFHEFAMGLQTDDLGNFYYAKSGRHARTSLIPQHGTLMKVSADGKTSDILAKGFRAANGVCLNPDGSFYVTDQEGYWNPMNRINKVTKGGFYGNMYGYNPPQDSSDEAMIPPMMWVDMKYDRSPAELLWADSDRWGPLNNSLLNLSYGYGKIFVVFPQTVNSVEQGGMIELPVPQFPTGLMRGRFNPKDGQLYTCGMSAWATSQMIQVGGLYRVRYTGKPLHIPIEMEVMDIGVKLVFSEPLDIKVASDIKHYEIKTWDLKRSRKYGSDRLNMKTISIRDITISENHKTIFLQLPEIEPTWIMEIKYNLKSSLGKSFKGAIQNTIYELE